MNKKDAIVTLMLFILFASIVFLSFENQKLKSNVTFLLKKLDELQENNKNLKKKLINYKKAIRT